MVTEIPTDLPPELVPLAWLVGEWQGRGAITHHKEVDSEETDGTTDSEKSEELDFEEQEFIQELSFTHRDLPYLEYKSETWLVNEDGGKGEPLTFECGIWQLDRNASHLDAGPGMFPADSEKKAFPNAEAVEHLRNPQDGFNVMANIVHPGGISELYVGDVKQARINLQTDMVMRTKGSKEYTAATRMYGWVNGELLWAWDIAANGKPLNSHASAQLKKVYCGEEK